MATLDENINTFFLIEDYFILQYFRRSENLSVSGTETGTTRLSWFIAKDLQTLGIAGIAQLVTILNGKSKVPSSIPGPGKFFTSSKIL